MIDFNGFSKDEEKLILQTYQEVLKYFNLEDTFLIEINLCDADTIRDLNSSMRNIDKVTDVLSFPFVNFSFPYNKNDYLTDYDFVTKSVILGEIDICKTVAIEQAKEYGHSLEREISFLSLHGFLHLFGFDHIEEEDRLKMRKAEKDIMSNLINKDSIFSRGEE